MRTKTQIIKIDQGGIAPAGALLISDVLRRDGVLVYPTETFYGLGALASSDKAVKRIYRLKRRDRGKPLSIVIADMAMAEESAASIPTLFRVLAREFWPGPLTLVLKAKPLFPSAMLGPGGTLAMRVPGVPWLRELIHSLGEPITATSANLSGEGEISDPERVVREFRGKADLIVDGGPTPGGLPSTIVDLTSAEPRILRAGAVPAAALRKYF
ncbi:MAG: L-threonylcarbamoyladenylate synthase [Candidatus Aminicenantes bacterium]|nr:L-threonylcarbamoyladenylate synthase [Candidatus Aminicenantes bacterium]